MVLSLIPADRSQGEGRRIELAGVDMVLGAIDTVFIYPFLDIDRLKNALARTISRWPIVAGRLHSINREHYFIELSDNPVPFNQVENEQLECWPTLPVVVGDRTRLQPFLDSVPSEPTAYEPLVQFKVTRLVRSNEYVLGVSFYHMLGDANTNVHFLSDLSCFYQRIEPVLPAPVFERHLWIREDASNVVDPSLMPMLKQLVDARPQELVIADFLEEMVATDLLCLCFSSIQLEQLRSLAAQEDEDVTVQDALTAYLIVTLNKHLFNSDNEHIRRMNTIINYRGVSDSLAPPGQVDNSIMFMPSGDFADPLSLSNVAKTIRTSIKKSRDESFLRRWLVTVDLLMRDIHKRGDAWNYVFYPNEIWVNSNMRYDWASLVDLGMTDQCRFHAMGWSKLRFCVFRLNPVHGEDGRWTRDRQGAEVSFGIPRGNGKTRFLSAWETNSETNFANVQ